MVYSYILLQNPHLQFTEDEIIAFNYALESC